MFDYAIIGAGPAGSMAAWQLAKKGYKVIVFEEHRHIGLPVKCAGLVSEHVIKIHNDGIINEIKGAIVNFAGKEIIIGGDKTHAYVIDRHIFDKSLAEKAMAEGVKFILGKRVRDIIEREKEFEIEGIKARYVIGSDGPLSITAKQFKMGEINFFNAIQGYGRGIDDEFVRVYIGNKIAPGFFAWIVPADKTRIGLATVEKGIRVYFNSFLKKVGIEAKEIFAALIPFGMRKLHRGNIALIGDAAGQVKATSGGGIYAALTAAITISNARNFEEYEKEYMKGFGKEIKRTILMRKIMNTFNDKMLNKIAAMAEKNIRLINKYGDIDYPSVLFKEGIKRLIFLRN